MYKLYWKLTRQYKYQPNRKICKIEKDQWISSFWNILNTCIDFEYICIIHFYYN